MSKSWHEANAYLIKMKNICNLCIVKFSEKKLWRYKYVDIIQIKHFISNEQDNDGVLISKINPRQWYTKENDSLQIASILTA